MLRTSTNGADAILPRGLAPPGLPWIADRAAAPVGWRDLPDALGRPALARDAAAARWPTAIDRAGIAAAARRSEPEHARPEGDAAAEPIVDSPAAPTGGRVRPGHLELAYTTQDADRARLGEARSVAALARRAASPSSCSPSRRSPTSFARAGPPARRDIDLVLLGWSSKFFDAYNILDLFPCGSAFNVAQWCDPRYDARCGEPSGRSTTPARWRIERTARCREAPAGGAGDPALLGRRARPPRARRARVPLVADRLLRADGHDALVDLEHLPRDRRVARARARRTRGSGGRAPEATRAPRSGPASTSSRFDSLARTSGSSSPNASSVSAAASSSRWTTTGLASAIDSIASIPYQPILSWSTTTSAAA